MPLARLCSHAARTLAAPAANAGMFDVFLEGCSDEAARVPFGREPDGSWSQPWEWQPPSDMERGPLLMEPRTWLGRRAQLARCLDGAWMPGRALRSLTPHHRGEIGSVVAV